MNRDELYELLEELYIRFNKVEFIEADPISIPHRYDSREDREIAGLLAATIAWGNRKAIVKSANRMMEFMDNAPHAFVMGASVAELEHLKGYVHRTFNGGDLIDFVYAMRGIFERWGSVGELFEQSYLRNKSMVEAISEFRREFFLMPHEQRCEKHISSIDKGAACKRINMYLRWMVRRDDRGVDFGLWSMIPSSALYMPLDVHSGDVARHLGLLSRKQNDWKAVSELTAALREFDVDDPVKYDFALFGAGVDGVFKE
ncbi:MAG: TIGR02757 family protein [Rikenellaceae bacterium]